MLDSKGFDLWADGYDKSVGLSDEDNTYPFAGYKAILNRIYNTVLARGSAVVCDIGFGTGVLTSRLFDRGCEIWGQDFSGKMLALARAKMPGAHIFQGDFSHGLAAELCGHTYDFIIATYSLHHLTDAEKIAFIGTLKTLLRPDGAILIGDVMFKTRADLTRCRQAAGDEWDDEEIYFVIDELKKSLPDMEFTQISHCGGIMTVRKMAHETVQG